MGPLYTRRIEVLAAIFLMIFNAATESFLTVYSSCLITPSLSSFQITTILWGVSIKAATFTGIESQKEIGPRKASKMVTWY